MGYYVKDLKLVVNEAEIRGGSRNLNRVDKWTFRATAA